MCTGGHEISRLHSAHERQQWNYTESLCLCFVLCFVCFYLFWFCGRFFLLNLNVILHFN